VVIASDSLFVRKVYPRLLVLGRHMCHQRAERSFYFGIRKFPVCARCTGMYLAVPLGYVASVFITVWWLYAILALPLVIDGLVQLMTPYESTNRRRLITGLLFGFATTGLIGLGISKLL